jgi:hypothetical protein
MMSEEEAQNRVSETGELPVSAPVSREGAESEVPEAGGPTVSVRQYLEMAIQTAAEQQMPPSELMGIFFYYAHSIAESYRAQALKRARENE